MCISTSERKATGVTILVTSERTATEHQTRKNEKKIPECYNYWIQVRERQRNVISVFTGDRAGADRHDCIRTND